MLSLVLLTKAIALLMIAIAANLDNLGIGTAYGIAQRKISAGSNLAIAIMAVGLTYVAMVFGQMLQSTLAAAVANNIGATLIIAVGIWIYWETEWSKILAWVYFSHLQRFLHPWLKQVTPKQTRWTESESHQTSHPSHFTFQTAKTIGWGETFVLGISLALNAMAGGFGASLSGYNAIYTSAAVGVFSYLTIAIGQTLTGTYLSKWIGLIANKVAGVLLIAIGLYEFFY